MSAARGTDLYISQQNASSARPHAAEGGLTAHAYGVLKGTPLAASRVVPLSTPSVCAQVAVRGTKCPLSDAMRRGLQAALRSPLGCLAPRRRARPRPPEAV